MLRQQLVQTGWHERSTGNTVKMTDLTSRVAQERERLQAVERLVSEIERKTILSTLELCRGSREETAQRLGISVSTLYRRLAEYRRDAIEPVQGQIRGRSKNPLQDGGVSH
jgi:DNA-binding NtrC family response regulator